MKRWHIGLGLVMVLTKLDRTHFEQEQQDQGLGDATVEQVPSLVMTDPGWSACIESQAFVRISYSMLRQSMSV